MQTRTQSEVVNSWRSSNDRPNILVIAPPEAEYAERISSLQQGDHPSAVVCVESPGDAVRLLRRGDISVVVMDGTPPEPGCLDVILEGLSKQRPPRFVILSPTVSGRPPATTALIRVVGAGLEWKILSQVILGASKDFESSGHQGIATRELLEAVVSFPDQAWLRICNESGEFGDLCFSGGRVVYSEVGALSGEPAAAKVLSWKSCLFEYREFPAFLAPNMNRRIETLGSSVPNGDGAAPPAVPAAEAIEATIVPETAPPVQPETEEPTEFPSLAQFAAALQPESAAGRPAPVDVEEPLGLPEFSLSFSSGDTGPDEPSFDPRAMDEYALVEEPVHMMLEDDEKLSSIDFEEPELPDFSQASFSQASMDAPPKAVLKTVEILEARARDSVFTSVAVIAAGKAELEECVPKGDRDYFHPAALREFFDRARQYAHRHRLGAPRTVIVSGSQASVALALVPGCERLLAVRFTSSLFGEKEEAELKILQDSLVLSAPVTSA